MKRFRQSLCMLAVFLFCLSAIPFAAFAQTLSFTGTVGESETFWFHQNYDDEVKEASIDNGGVPGMSLSFPNPAAVTLSGTPTQAGSYTLYVSVYTVSQEWLQYTLVITIEEAPQTQPTEPPQVDLRPSVSAVPKVTKHPTGETVMEGGSATFIARADYTNKYAWEITIADAVLGVDQLASYIGKSVIVSGANSETLVLSNIPMELNNAYVRCRFIGAEESVYSEYAKITVVPATPKITKDPTDETIQEGEEAVFVAKADYAQKYTWKLVAPDGKVILCAEAGNVFAGLKVSGADTERIVLSNVPAELDGYRIYCEFTGGNTVVGGKAKLTVIPKPTEAPTTEPETTEAPTTEPPTEPEKETQSPTSEPAATPEPEVSEEAPSPQKGSGNGLIITIIAAVTVLAVAAIAAFVILKLKGKL